MGPGDDCPPHLIRYVKGTSVARLSERFALPEDPYMQDWEVEVADFSRVDEFLAAYSDPALVDDDRFALVQLTVASLDDGLHSGADISARFALLEAIVRSDSRLHAATLSYWALGDDPDPEHQFMITPLIRRIWNELRGLPALASPM